MVQRAEPNGQGLLNTYTRLSLQDEPKSTIRPDGNVNHAPRRISTNRSGMVSPSKHGDPAEPAEQEAGGLSRQLVPQRSKPAVK